MSMPRSLETIVQELKALTPEEFDERSPTARGIERLEKICDDVRCLPVPRAAFPEFFHLMERLSDSHLGSPGALVHTMEEHVGSYEDLLVASVSRMPTALTVWMVNRVLNAATQDRGKWLAVLAIAAAHPAASQVARNQACRFIAFQQKT
jgi:hypothetical protein